MNAILAQNSYGKSAVRLLKVVRHGTHHDIRELAVDIALEGAFESAHTTGDNSMVLPTDTMKNTVYAKARELSLGEPEDFALTLATHFLAASPAASSARVAIKEHGWRRLIVDGTPHQHAFERASNELRAARVSLARGGAAEVVAGIEELLVLKSGRSAFSGYPRDQYTTLRETDDRILATSISTSWRYSTGATDFGNLFTSVRRALLEKFAEHDSKSVQHTLYAMGEAVIEHVDAVDEISITMPNKHHLLVDLTPLGLENANDIFVPTSEPYGLIEATLKRQRTPSK
ncbi:MAG: factor-independent urate hydroxylase [bacterium]